MFGLLLCDRLVRVLLTFTGRYLQYFLYLLRFVRVSLASMHGSTGIFGLLTSASHYARLIDFHAPIVLKFDVCFASHVFCWLSRAGITCGTFGACFGLHPSNRFPICKKLEGGVRLGCESLHMQYIIYNLKIDHFFT